MQNLQKRIIKKKKKKGQNRDCELPAPMAFVSFHREGIHGQTLFSDSSRGTSSGMATSEHTIQSDFLLMQGGHQRCPCNESRRGNFSRAQSHFPLPHSLSSQATADRPARRPARQSWARRTCSSSGNRCGLSSNTCLCSQKLQTT